MQKHIAISPDLAENIIKFSHDKNVSFSNACIQLAYCGIQRLENTPKAPIKLNSVIPILRNRKMKLPNIKNNYYVYFQPQHYNQIKNLCVQEGYRFSKYFSYLIYLGLCDMNYEVNLVFEL